MKEICEVTQYTDFSSCTRSQQAWVENAGLGHHTSAHNFLSVNILSNVTAAYLVFCIAHTVAVLEWKNWRGHCEAKEKSREVNINVSPAWWFSVVMKMICYDQSYQTQHRLMNIVRTVARKSSNRLKFCWLQVICCICQSNKLEHELKHKTGGPSRVQPKIWRGHGPPPPPALEPLLDTQFLTMSFKWLHVFIQ